MDYGRSDLADKLAALYVAGTLRGGARRRLETLLPAHPTLRAAVRLWQDRMMPLTAVIPPVLPPASVWQRIQTRIGGRASDEVGAASIAQAAKASGLAFWRALAGLATVAAVAFGVMLATPSPALPPVVVVLASTGAAASDRAPASLVASISGDGRAMVMKPLVDVSVRAGRVLELWAIPGGGTPRSLGVISARGGSLAVKGQVLAGVESLAVSLEPDGGSTTGQPTGPVLYAGKVAPL